MVKNRILDLENINKEYSFVFTKGDTDRYFCSCGEQFQIINEEEVVELEEVLGSDDDEIYGSIYKDIKLSFDAEVKCPHCEKNYNNPDNKRKLISINEYFISGFEFIETDVDLIFYYAKACPGIASRTSEEGEEYKVVFDEKIKYIRFEKESKSLFFQDFGDSPEVEFDLDEVIKYVDMFFTSDTDKIINFFKLHMYINRLANFVSDTKNTQIVSEFLEHIRNTPNDVGVPYTKKLLSIFYGIIKYSNLSTVALTKGSQFLYDLMLKCDIPNSKEMEESGATSPVKIFNFLVTKYINKLNEEVNLDNKEAHDFVYKSKQRVEYENDKNRDEEDLNYEVKEDDIDALYKVRENKEYKGGKVVQVDGRYHVLDAVEDGTISKFIFKTIRDFSDYTQLIKYFKFYDKHELIALIQKHDIDLLTHAIEAIYFRKKMEFKELSRVLSIIDTFLDSRFFFKDYNNVHQFSFVEYDDAQMMMEIMEFDPKKHFTKIDNYDDLVEYHDMLVKYYKVRSDEQNIGAIKDFVSKFKFLESKEDYDGPIEIVLHDSPGMIIKEGVEMRHSASAYAINVAQGTYVLGSIYDRDPERPEDEMERFTIGFTYNKNYNELEFDQVKGFGNKRGSNRFKRHMMDFLTEKDISFKPIKDLKLDEEYGDE